jgi:putative two-component system response regulator
VKDQIEELAEAQMATIFALARLAESRDSTLGRHVERVQLCCRVLGNALVGMESGGRVVDDEFVNTVVQACPLHDIGKVGIADIILLKPGRLTNEEFEVMKHHSILGWETLDAALQRFPHSEFLQMGATIARSHHERWDGEGYPDGLAGDEIPLEARIMAIADVYDAIRSKRCYKDPQPHLVALDQIVQGAGTWFDPAMVEAFKRAAAHLNETLSADNA